LCPRGPRIEEGESLVLISLHKEQSSKEYHPPLKGVILIYNYIGMRPHSPMVKTPQLHCGIIGSIPVGVKFRNLFFIFSSGFTQEISQRKLKRRKVEKYLNLPGASCASGEGFKYEYGQYRYSLGQCRDYI
jgi:hypothetical protein